jgi:hypothetical protein
MRPVSSTDQAGSRNIAKQPNSAPVRLEVNWPEFSRDCSRLLTLHYPPRPEPSECGYGTLTAQSYPFANAMVSTFFTDIKHGKRRDYESVYLRRTYRDGGRMRNETLANLSMLPRGGGGRDRGDVEGAEVDHARRGHLTSLSQPRRYSAVFQVWPNPGRPTGPRSCPNGPSKRATGSSIQVANSAG